jgi:hypothetical protein
MKITLVNYPSHKASEKKLGARIEVMTPHATKAKEL